MEVGSLREELGSNMATNDIQPMPGGEPELNLLLSKSDLDQPLWKSLVQNLDDFFFPKKLPPLVLESKPIAVILPAATTPRAAKSSWISALIRFSWRPPTRRFGAGLR